MGVGGFELPDDRSVGDDHEHFHEFVLKVDGAGVAHIVFMDKVPDVGVLVPGEGGDIILKEGSTFNKLSTDKEFAFQVKQVGYFLHRTHLLNRLQFLYFEHRIESLLDWFYE